MKYILIPAVLMFFMASMSCRHLIPKLVSFPQMLFISKYVWFKKKKKNQARNWRKGIEHMVKQSTF